MPSIDLTIPLTELDIEDLLSDWRWKIPEDFVPIQMTKFGDWFFGDPQQRIYMLDLLEGTLQEVAPSLAAYNQLKNSPEKQGEWFLDAFVFRCTAEGLLLAPGQCYGWKVHPMMGGKIAFENIRVFTLRVYQSLTGQIFRQMQNHKPGDPLPRLTIDPA